MALAQFLKRNDPSRMSGTSLNDTQALTSRPMNGGGLIGNSFESLNGGLSSSLEFIKTHKRSDTANGTGLL